MSMKAHNNKSEHESMDISLGEQGRGYEGLMEHPRQRWEREYSHQNNKYGNSVIQVHTSRLPHLQQLITMALHHTDTLHHSSGSKQN